MHAMINETPEIDFRDTFSPKKNPSDVSAVAQMKDAIKKIREVSFVFVSASPAIIGIKALTEGMSFPMKMYHMPWRVNVA